MKSLSLKHLGKFIKEHGAHTRSCDFWAEKKREACNCGLYSVKIDDLFRRDAIELLEAFALKACDICSAKQKVFLGPNGYYHSHPEENVYEQWCEASPLYALADELRPTEKASAG